MCPYTWFKNLFKRKKEETVAEVVEPQPVVEEEVVEEMVVVELPDFTKMTKLEIDIYAKSKHGIKLDRRKKKDTMISELIKQIK